MILCHYLLLELILSMDSTIYVENVNNKRSQFVQAVFGSIYIHEHTSQKELN